MSSRAEQLHLLLSWLQSWSWLAYVHDGDTLWELYTIWPESDYVWVCQWTTPKKVEYRENLLVRLKFTEIECMYNLLDDRIGWGPLTKSATLPQRLTLSLHSACLATGVLVCLRCSYMLQSIDVSRRSPVRLSATENCSSCCRAIYISRHAMWIAFLRNWYFSQQFDLWPISLTVSFQVHNKCATNVVPECNLGQHRDHILPPVSISPATLVCVQALFPYASKVCYKAPPQFCWHPD